MSGYNHIVGGTVFTGIFLSMYDINIFSQPIYLFFTAFFSVLPDIDHTKAPIGKMFYPLARYLDKNYGHRTITHSLLIYGILFFMIAIIESFTSQKTIITSIFLWSFASHLILDMITKQGVPLFYPFMKNPCVIPANPSYRFKSSDMKTEATVFVFFVFLGFSCKNLFANGFWNTYNKTFSNIKHIYNETKLFDGIIDIQYEIKKDGIGKKSTGIVINATENELILFNKSFIAITNKDRIIKLIPTRTKKHLIVKEINFTDVSGDSLRSIIRNKPIIKLRAEGTIPINYKKENEPVFSKTLDLDYSFNPVFQSQNIDTIDAAIEQQINILNQEIANDNANKISLAEAQRETKRMINDKIQMIAQSEKDLNSENLYIKEQAMKRLPAARMQLEQLQQNSTTYIKNNFTQIRMKYLQSKLRYKKLNTITGYITYAEIQ